MDTQNLLFKMGFIRDAELRVWDAKIFGPVSPGTHKSKFVKKSLVYAMVYHGLQSRYFFRDCELFGVINNLFLCQPVTKGNIF